MVIIIIITIIIIFIIIIIIIITYFWVMGTREQVPQSNLFKQGQKQKTLNISYYLALNINISPENMGMDIMVLKV